MSDPWYPAADVYYVPAEEAGEDQFPIRQGDLFLPPEGFTDSKRRPWYACQLVHPSCEIVAKSDPSKLHAIRVRALGEAKPKFQDRIVEGGTLVDGKRRADWANTFFLPPATSLDQPMFSDFQQLFLVPRAHFTVGNRVAALTHDARVYFIRRKLYWEQRWVLDLDDVYRLEAVRIGNDSRFIGPKPEWATSG